MGGGGTLVCLLRNLSDHFTTHPLHTRAHTSLTILTNMFWAWNTRGMSSTEPDTSWRTTESGCYTLARSEHQWTLWCFKCSNVDQNESGQPGGRGRRVQGNSMLLWIQTRNRLQSWGFCGSGEWSLQCCWVEDDWFAKARQADKGRVINTKALKGKPEKLISKLIFRSIYCTALHLLRAGASDVLGSPSPVNFTPSRSSWWSTSWAQVVTPIQETKGQKLPRR